MSIHPKLKDIPHIYYLNLDNEVQRTNYMETQFKDLGITNFTRVSASKFLKNDFDSWKHLVHLNDIIPKNRYKSLSVSISHLEILRKWIEESEEQSMIVMEDDTDLSLVKYWHFDWKYLMDNIPYDWDAIQLMYNSNYRIYCFLHPKKLLTWNGPLLINRDYAKKLISLYYINGKYNFIKKTNRVNKSNSLDKPGSQGRFTLLDVDEFMGFNGKVYQLPLFSQNPYFDNPPKSNHVKSHNAHMFWWTQMRDKFTLDDFFTYGKLYDNKMILNLSSKNKQ